MNESGKSDKPVVPMKPANSGASLNFWEFIEHLERVEGRGLAKENEDHNGNETEAVFQAGPAKQTDRTQSRLEESSTLDEGLHSELDRVRQAACRDKELKFTSLWHHVYNIDRLREAYFALKRNVAAGIDGETWQAYGQELESNLKDLSERLVLGTYRAKPVKRVYIPKADGRKRPIGIPVLEDKIVQRAAVQVLNAIYETDFDDSSYGYRPGRSAHMALDALGFTHICDKKRKDGKFIVLRQTITKRMHAKLQDLKQTLRRCMHRPISDVGRWLGQVVNGHYRYYGVPRNYPALDLFRDRVRRLWQRVMNLRDQKGRISEKTMSLIADRWLPKPRIFHPYPEARLAS